LLVAWAGRRGTLWAVGPVTPTVVGTGTFSSPLRRAVLTGTIGYFLLDDRTLWTANLVDVPVTSKQIAINLAPQFIARSGSNIAVAELRADGTTTIGMLNASLSGIGPSVNVPG